jgi:D-ribulokinase
LSEGGQSATGALIEHVLFSHKAYPAAVLAAEGKGLTIYEYLNGRLEHLRLRSGLPTYAHLTAGIFGITQSYLADRVYPDFAGNRSPLGDSTLRGAIQGLTLDADLDTLTLHYYATIEALGHQTRHIIECLNNAGHQVKSIFMSGGQCQNEVVTRVMSKCGYPYLRLC